jgi:hypothetical protein
MRQKMNGFKKMGVHRQIMILNASTVDVNLPVAAPIPSLITFPDLKMLGQAWSPLKYELQNRFSLNFEPSRAFATELHAHLLWDRMDYLSNFSIFFCGRSAAFSATPQESLMLHMSPNKDSGFLEAHTTKAIKQPRLLPADVIRAVEQIQSYHGALVEMIGGN